jgi:tRNA nucleotidyltransferase/poly(A) polymerase
VKDTFSGSAVIVGRRFPIVHVHDKNSIVEVRTPFYGFGQTLQTAHSELVAVELDFSFTPHV